MDRWTYQLDTSATIRLIVGQSKVPMDDGLERRTQKTEGAKKGTSIKGNVAAASPPNYNIRTTN